LARITRSGRAVRLVHDNGSVPAAEADQSLLRLILKARRWWAILRQGEITLTELAQREGVTSSYMCRVMRVAFLSPEVVRGALAGRQRVGTNVELLRYESSVPANWREQSAMLLPG
jgi:site-specific DNA recombinase